MLTNQFLFEILLHFVICTLLLFPSKNFKIENWAAVNLLNVFFFFSILQEGNLFWLRVRDGMSVLKLLMLCWSYTVMLSSRVLEKPHCHLLHELFWFYLFFALEPNISRTASSDHSDWNIIFKKKKNKPCSWFLVFDLMTKHKAVTGTLWWPA